MASAWSIVARTEYAEGARSQWFKVMTVLVPVLMAASLLFTGALMKQATEKPSHVALVDRSAPSIGEIVRTALTKPRDGKSHFEIETVTGERAELSSLEARIGKGELDGFLLLPPDIAEGGHALYRGTNASSLSEIARLASSLKAAVMAGRARSLGLREDQLGSLIADVSLDAEQANGSGKASGSSTFLAAYFASFLLYLSILIYGVTVARSVVHEKTSRIIELLVACARPWELMVGKIVGVGALGLTQMGIWVGTGLVLVRLRGPLLARFGIQGAETFELPPLGASELVILFVYFLGGYFLYASLFAAVGAASSSEREAQQAQMPLVLPLVAALMCFPVITTNPRGGAAIAMTLVPFFSPVLMPMRFMLTPIPAWELATSIVLMVLTTAATAFLGARIYRVGILMYGKKPTFLELLRWIRES